MNKGLQVASVIEKISKQKDIINLTIYNEL